MSDSTKITFTRQTGHARHSRSAQARVFQVDVATKTRLARWDSASAIEQYLTAYPFEMACFCGRPLDIGWIANRLARRVDHPGAPRW